MEIKIKKIDIYTMLLYLNGFENEGQKFEGLVNEVLNGADFAQLIILDKKLKECNSEIESVVNELKAKSTFSEDETKKMIDDYINSLNDEYITINHTLKIDLFSNLKDPSSFRKYGWLISKLF